MVVTLQAMCGHLQMVNDITATGIANGTLVLAACSYCSPLVSADDEEDSKSGIQMSRPQFVPAAEYCATARSAAAAG